MKKTFIYVDVIQSPMNLEMCLSFSCLLQLFRFTVWCIIIYLCWCHSVTHEPRNASVILLSVTAFQVHCLMYYLVTLRLLIF